ncbi:MAG: glycosyltransferase family A protein [Candidatus Bathyarchaeota archaeon]|jgi:glycosyltransferase involved in cell wall biosynthesis
MKAPVVCAVIPARNEEEALPATLEMLKAQTLPPHKIIIVDDGSTDKTAEKARKMNCIVVDRPSHRESYIGKPELAEVINAGLNQVPKICDYVLLLGADHRLPPNYIEKLVRRMKKNSKLVIAGGVISGEQAVETLVRGSGRLVNAEWWSKQNGMKYPVAYGWEPWLCYKALSLNHEVKSFPDLVTCARTTSLTGAKARGLGKSMKGLGYDVTYALGRVALTFFRGHRKASLAMLQGYLSKVERLDVADWVGNYQKRIFWKRVREILTS